IMCSFQITQIIKHTVVTYFFLPALAKPAPPASLCRITLKSCGREPAVLSCQPNNGRLATSESCGREPVVACCQPNKGRLATSESCGREPVVPSCQPNKSAPTTPESCGREPVVVYCQPDKKHATSRQARANRSVNSDSGSSVCSPVDMFLNTKAPF